MIHVKTPGNLESTSNDLSSVQKSKISTDPIERSTKAMLEGIAWESSDVRPHIRPSSKGLNETLTTGESSPGQGVHLTEISNHFNAGITGEIFYGEVAGAPVTTKDQMIHQTNLNDEDNHPQVTIVNTKQHLNMNVSSTWQGKGTTNLSDQKEKSPSNPNEIEDAQDNLELKDDSNTSKDQVQNQAQNSSSEQQHKEGTCRQQGDQHTIREVIILSPESQKEAMQAGKVSKTSDKSAVKEFQSVGELHKLGEVQAVDETGQSEGHRELVDTQHNYGKDVGNHPPLQNHFPQISNNFVRHNSHNAQNKQVVQDHPNPKEPNKHNEQHQPNKGAVQEPAPYTVVQTYAARLRYNQAKNTTPILFEKPKVTTKQGKMAVIFKEEDFMTNWATDCRFTLIGKFIA
ncbi:hypothetical protein H5410_064453 [Solanum commersonii]|uniref:Uncharacterized protein n=1 Tax=Solanum commersonii TaxID=4109 RepID=A0A9J5VZC9_SOLCO|nr:hypothetical protein H5410_064453 [Solanum commersonii]